MSASASAAWSPFVLAGLLLGAGCALLRLRVEERGPFRPSLAPTTVLQSPQIALMPPPPRPAPTTRPAPSLAEESARASRGPDDGLTVIFRRDGGAPRGGGFASLVRARDGSVAAQADIVDGRAEFAPAPRGEALRLRAAFREPSFAELDAPLAASRPANRGSAWCLIEPATRPVLSAVFHSGKTPLGRAQGVLRWRAADAPPEAPYEGAPIALDSRGELRTPAPPPGALVHVLLWRADAASEAIVDAFFDSFVVPAGPPRDVALPFRRVKPPPVRFAGAVIGAPRDEPGEVVVETLGKDGPRTVVAPVDRRGRFCVAGVDAEGAGLLRYRHPRLAAAAREAPDGTPDAVLVAAPTARVRLDLRAPPDLGARLDLRIERTDGRTARERAAAPHSTRTGDAERFRLAIEGLPPGVYDVRLIEREARESLRYEFQRVTLAPGEDRVLFSGTLDLTPDAPR